MFCFNAELKIQLKILTIPINPWTLPFIATEMSLLLVKLRTDGELLSLKTTERQRKL